MQRLHTRIARWAGRTNNEYIGSRPIRLDRKHHRRCVVVADYAGCVTDATDRTPRDLLPYRVGTLLSATEGVLLLGFSAFFGYEISAGATDDVVRGATSGALILVFALFLLFLARGWARRADWPRTPTLLWNALLLPVAWSLWQSNRALVSLGVAVVAICSIVAALGARPNDPIRRDEPSEDGRLS